MDGSKILEATEIYRKKLADNSIVKAKDYRHDLEVYSRADALKHCLGMLDKIDGFVRDNQMDKAFRWLGFVQGCLWSASLYTLDDLKNHNRPKDENEIQ